jgi:hypothetical protein
VRAVERRGLHCRTYQKLPLSALKSRLAQGYCAVVVAENGKAKHTSSVFAAGGGLYTSDGLVPFHAVNEPRPARLLDHGALCLIVGKQPIPVEAGSRAAWWTLGIVSSVTFCALIRRRRKGLS